MSPVFVPKPEASRSYFKTNIGGNAPYNLIWNNCKNYVMNGLRAGGADIRNVSPFPKEIAGAYTMVWTQAGGQQPNNSGQ
jgi:hypothetical protein